MPAAQSRMGQECMSGKRHRSPRRRPEKTASAIGQSLDIYYRDAARTRRMDALNRAFVPEGGLAFDIGAHVGDRTGSFLRLGATVVAVEPQPHVFRALQLIHGRDPRAALECAAVGERAGILDFHVNSANPTVSTASRDLMAAAADADAWRDERWDSTIQVPVTTLDHLVAQHGLPDFVKIDVEGHELAVLEGLSAAPPALSFEYTTIQREVALSCIDRLEALGRFEYNLSFGEEHRLQHTRWICAARLRALISGLPEESNSGDIFVRRLN